MSCLFCKIAAGEIPTDFVYEDEHCVAFNDISPQAPNHVLVIPRKHIESMAEVTEEDSKLFGHLMTTVSRIADELGLGERGYRTVINTKDEGGQTVFHLHIHLLGGRQFIFPPG